jgi:hypothetical protein
MWSGCHEHPGCDGPAVVTDGLAEEGEEVGAIAIVEEDCLAVITTRGDVMNSSGILDACLSCHASEDPSGGRGVQQFVLTRGRKNPKTSSEW